MIQADIAMSAKDVPKNDPADVQLKGMGWGLATAPAVLPDTATPPSNHIDDEMRKLGWAKPLPPDVNVAWMATKTFLPTHIYPWVVPAVSSMNV